MGKKMDRANPFKAFDEDITSPATLEFAYRYGQLQCFCAAWREKIFGKFPEADHYQTHMPQFHRIRDEMNEFLTAYELYSHAPSDEYKLKVQKEAADVVIVLFNHCADVLDFNLLFEVMQKMRTNLAREWRSNGDGTGQHTKKAPWEQETNK